MAETRRSFIYGALFSSLLCILFIVLGLSTDNWIVSKAVDTQLTVNSYLNYGLFRGELELNNLATPTFSTLYVTCVFEERSCAVSCKTTEEARRDEVIALANGQRPNPACTSTTVIDTQNPLGKRVRLHFSFYVSFLALIFLQLVFAVTSAGLAILNVTKNPTEPIFGLPGCFWSNVVTAILGAAVLLAFGIYWATSSLQEHLAFSYFANGVFEPDPALGYSYWLSLLPIVCSLTNVALIEVRKRLLDRDPPPPTIKVENHSDGTIFLY